VFRSTLVNDELGLCIELIGNRPAGPQFRERLPVQRQDFGQVVLNSD
jgi:hypothetical protein